MQDFKSHILLVNSPIEAANEYYQNENPEFCRLFCAEELVIEISRAIIDESYIASDGVKKILIAANSFNQYAQNALLKILEEPPSQVCFILFAKRKSQLLPTIRSRMPIVNNITKEKNGDFPISISQISLQEIYNFLKERSKSFDNSTLKEDIQNLYLASIKAGIVFNTKEIEVFEDAFRWASSGEKAQNILIVLLLMILEKKKQAIEVYSRANASRK